MKKSTESGQTGPITPENNFARIDAIVTPPTKIIDCPPMDFKTRTLSTAPWPAEQVV